MNRLAPVLVVAAVAFLAAMAGVCGAAGQPGGEVFYAPPDSLDFSLTPLVGPPQAPPWSFSGKIDVLTGNPTNLQVFFESSPDLLVTPARDAFPAMKYGQEKEFRLVVTAGKGKADAGGSWLRMRIVYLPDYDAQAAAVASDTAEYPEPAERARLLATIAGNREKQAPQTDAIRYFFSRTTRVRR